MKFSNMLLSLLLHAGLVAGVMHGMQRRDEDSEEPFELEFFEILEECTVEISKPIEPVKADGGKAIEVEPPAPNPTESVEGDLIQTQSPDGEGEAGPEENETKEVAKEKEEEKEKEEVNDGRNPIDAGDESEAVKPAQEERSKVVSAPAALNRIVPVYPRSARRRGREGIVTLEISVSGSGEVSGVEVLAGSGYEDLDSAAVSAVRTARFAPATEDGVQVCGCLRLSFEFKLR